ncbi:uncharacterized protein LOC134256680 [Saccostrea cucullata]|uniref:uncharacterized protein LOC134256680 n=1 Tax=Saccostrea cuccullata TaxID=36930 RepID=UPI002ED39673
MENIVIMDFSDEVLQMYAEIKENSTYDYMICKFNNGRLVIEHIEKVENDKSDRNYSYEEFTKKLKGKQTFRYGFATFDWIENEDISRKTVGVLWDDARLQTYPFISDDGIRIYTSTCTEINPAEERGRSSRCMVFQEFPTKDD